ncbi:carbonic anhydrase 6-like [Dermacentor andersoni]|uniref:carbonic anhydrase 6-like n=1 Tax=Dermacentor andersoni TaxID=34620 RepID=UPI0024175425|nr:uncharacterized protein LOC126542491 [Dermacentor andersoni]
MRRKTREVERKEAVAAQTGEAGREAKGNGGEASANVLVTLCGSWTDGLRALDIIAADVISGINYRGQHGAPVSSVLVTTWLLCWSFHGSEQARRPMRRLVAGRSLTPLGWGEYCDGTRWAYKTPQCGNATRADTVDTKNEAGWPAFESACGSPSQSPININFLQTSFKSFGPISFLGYNVPFRFAIENGGHALYITPLYAHLESYGGPLPARYNLSKGIFHFGNETSPRGSEHTIDDRNFAAELQLLVSSEKPTPTECIRRGQGLAIFVILFEKHEQNNPFLDTLINASEHMTYRGNKTEVTMPLAYLLPNTTQHYYIYLGSLSFPPCTSDAFVVVFRSTVAIGEQQASGVSFHSHMVLYGVTRGGRRNFDYDQELLMTRDIMDPCAHIFHSVLCPSSRQAYRYRADLYRKWPTHERRPMANTGSDSRSVFLFSFFFFLERGNMATLWLQLESGSTAWKLNEHCTGNEE